MMTVATFIKYIMKNYASMFRKIKLKFLLIREMHVYTCVHGFRWRII